MRVIAAALSLFLTTTLAPAQTIAVPGDVVVSYEEFCYCGFMFPTLAVLTPEGRGRLFSFAGGGDVLAAPDGTLRVLSVHSPGKVVTYSAALHEIGTLDVGMYAQSLAMDRDENLYAIAGDGEVRRFSKSGALVSSYRIPLSQEGVISADLGVDQCTMYYFANSPSRKRIGRYDLCRHQELPDITQAFSRFLDYMSIRVAHDGGVLLAADGMIYRFADGQTRSIKLPASDQNNVAIVPEPGGRYVWSAGWTLARHDLLTGETVARGHLQFATRPTLAIYGIPRASTAPVPSPVPAASSSLLVLLGITLGVTAWLSIPRC